MSSVFDEIRQEAAAKAEARAEAKVAKAEAKAAKAAAKAEARAKAKAAQEKENFVLGLLKLGKLTLEEVAECSGLSMAKVRKLAQTLG